MARRMSSRICARYCLQDGRRHSLQWTGAKTSRDAPLGVGEVSVQSPVLGRQAIVVPEFALRTRSGLQMGLRAPS